MKKIPVLFFLLALLTPVFSAHAARRSSTQPVIVVIKDKPVVSAF